MNNDEKVVAYDSFSGYLTALCAAYGVPVSREESLEKKLQKCLAVERKIALDTQVSEEAAALVERGKREAYQEIFGMKPNE